MRGLLDWSNALIGDPTMELGRLAEYALLPQNGLDYEAALAGYREPVPVDSAAFWIYRLDATVMLGLLFYFPGVPRRAWATRGRPAPRGVPAAKPRAEQMSRTGTSAVPSLLHGIPHATALRVGVGVHACLLHCEGSSRNATDRLGM